MFATKTAQATHHLMDQAASMLDRAEGKVSALANEGAETVRHGSQVLRNKAYRASDMTVSYIREEPVKSVLIAAAVGAGVLALLAMASRARR